jgi:hypothetical protein
VINNLFKALEISISKKISTSNSKNDSQGKNTQTNCYLHAYLQVV